LTDAHDVRLIVSTSDDVYENLAAEEALLDAAPAGPVVFIYRNAPAVVIGKNQNPWRECAVGHLDALGVRLARRISGGGTVYHDPGNLNVACILPRAAYRREEVLDLYINGLARAGVKAEITGGTSLAVTGRKVSGNAFCFRRDHVLHHGTLLWGADLERLRAVLTPDHPEVETRAVASNPMPVVNLGELLPGHTPDDLLDAMVAALGAAWGAVERDHEIPDPGDRVMRLRAWEWLYGATPDFMVRHDGRNISVHRGRVVAVEPDDPHGWTGQCFGELLLCS
jgi:lipoate-protein ligase A